jgi:lysozyme
MMTNADGVKIIRKYQRTPAMPLKTAEKIVRASVTVDLNVNQFSALVSLLIDIGGKCFDRSMVLKHINNGKPIAAAYAFGSWVWRGGRRRNLMVRRRELEKQLFLRPVIVVENNK